jgi:hypothetical protein
MALVKRTGTVGRKKDRAPRERLERPLSAWWTHAPLRESRPKLVVVAAAAAAERETIRQLMRRVVPKAEGYCALNRLVKNADGTWGTRPVHVPVTGARVISVNAPHGPGVSPGMLWRFHFVNIPQRVEARADAARFRKMLARDEKDDAGAGDGDGSMDCAARDARSVV